MCESVQEVYEFSPASRFSEDAGMEREERIQLLEMNEVTLSSSLNYIVRLLLSDSG